ncbi:MAG: ankyrin repeat domain-containing protein [Woeseiaceae bacterium]
MKKILLLVFTIPLVVVSLAIYAMVTLNIQQLIICASDEGAFYIPKSICKYYMHNYRGDDKDILLLESSSGISYLFETRDDSEKYKQIEFFIEKGADINHISKLDGLSPLHTAILLNDSKLVEFLLIKKADPLQIESNNNMSSYQYVDFLILNEKRKSTNRDNIRKILLKFKNKNT